MSRHVNPILTIAIPTVMDREFQFGILYNTLLRTIATGGWENEVEVIYEQDNKEISIGAKRQKLIDRATGKYMMMLDDDDWLGPDYIPQILEAAKDDPDTIGYLEEVSIEGRKFKTSCISMKWKQWDSNVGLYDYVRTPYFKNPIRTSLCKQVGCADMRFGEDADFAKKIHPLLKTEVFIDKKMYIYRYKHENHNWKYGIKA